MAATAWITRLEPFADARPAVEIAEPSFAPAIDLEAVRAEARALREQAEADAAETLNDARMQAEALREAAWQEGHHAGNQEAVARVEAEARAAREEWENAIRSELDSLMAQIAEARQALWLRQEAEMVALTLDIARQVIKTEVSQNGDVIRQVIGNALRRVTDKEKIRVRVCPTDASAVKGMREEFIEMLDGLRHLEILDDRRVGPGGCVIETNAGTIDAKIETQLAEVARALGVTENE